MRPVYKLIYQRNLPMREATVARSCEAGAGGLGLWPGAEHPRAFREAKMPQRSEDAPCNGPRREGMREVVPQPVAPK